MRKKKGRSTNRGGGIPCWWIHVLLGTWHGLQSARQGQSRRHIYATPPTPSTSAGGHRSESTTSRELQKRICKTNLTQMISGNVKRGEEIELESGGGRRRRRQRGNLQQLGGKTTESPGWPSRLHPIQQLYNNNNNLNKHGKKEILKKKRHNNTRGASGWSKSAAGTHWGIKLTATNHAPSQKMTQDEHFTSKTDNFSFQIIDFGSPENPIATPSQFHRGIKNLKFPKWSKKRKQLARDVGSIPQPKWQGREGVSLYSLRSPPPPAFVAQYRPLQLNLASNWEEEEEEDRRGGEEKNGGGENGGGCGLGVVEKARKKERKIYD